MIKFKKKDYLLIIFIACILTLVTAYFVQYILSYQPCKLCIIERFPYMIAIIILILNYNFEKDVLFFNVLLLQIFAFSFIISLYHLGIEQGIISESAVCASEKIDLISKEDILNSLQELNVSCKDVTIKIFGLSLTTYNMILSLLIFLISIKIYLINNDNKK
jgi:disulfide bond formation protein DsbB